MRYRSYGRSETAVSTLTLELKDVQGRARASDWRSIVFGGLENGVNAFDIHVGASPGLLAGAAEAFAAIERRLSFITLRCRVAPHDLENGVVLRAAAETAERLGLETFNCIMLEGEHLESLTRPEVERMTELREITKHLGVAGGESLDRLARHGIIDSVATNYSLASPVRDRNRIRLLGSTGAAVITSNTFPETVLQAPEAPRRAGLFGKTVYAPAGPYDFLRETYGWTPEQICLAYVLTEPGVTTVRVATTDLKFLATLSTAAERDVPGGLAAQVEMARFTESPSVVQARRSA